MKDERFTNDVSVSKSQTITIIRILAMSLIILCHYFAYFDDLSPISQFLNVGVPIFFIISGFLYGAKTVTNLFRWYKKQYIKIVIPIFSYYIVSAIILCIFRKIGNIDFIEAIKLLLNIQGVAGGKIGNIQSSHLWFITFILFCYLITPLLQFVKIRLSFKSIMLSLVSISTLWIALVCLLPPLPFFISWFPGVLLYIFAYCLSGYWQTFIKSKLNYIITTVFMFLSLGLRLFSKHLVDGVLPAFDKLYTNIIVPYTQCVLAFWIFFTVFLFCTRYSSARIFLSKKLNPFDKYSYCIYIVHYMFVEGVFALSVWTDNYLLLTVMFVTLSSIFAFVLQKISFLLIKK